MAPVSHTSARENNVLLTCAMLQPHAVMMACSVLPIGFCSQRNDLVLRWQHAACA